jgi:hypothetical protein
MWRRLRFLNQLEGKLLKRRLSKLCWHSKANFGKASVTVTSCGAGRFHSITQIADHFAFIALHPWLLSRKHL